MNMNNNLWLQNLKNKIMNGGITSMNNPVSTFGNYAGGTLGGMAGSKLGEKIGLDETGQTLTGLAGNIGGQMLANNLLGGVGTTLGSSALSGGGGALTSAISSAAPSALSGLGSAGLGGAGAMAGGATALGTAVPVVGAVLGAGMLANSLFQGDKQKSNAALQLAQQAGKQAEQENQSQVNSIHNAVFNNTKNINPYMTSTNTNQPVNYEGLLNAQLNSQPQIQQSIVSQSNNSQDGYNSIKDEIIKDVYGGKDLSRTIPQSPQGSQTGFINNLVSGLGDLKSGFTENATNALGENVEMPNESKMYKVGEALGTANRVMQNPYVQGLIAGGLYGIDKGDALYGLGKGVEWASNRANTNNYRDMLKQEGININPGILGTISSNDYGMYARRPVRQAEAKLYNSRANQVDTVTDQLEKDNNLTMGDYFKQALASGKYKTEQDMINDMQSKGLSFDDPYNAGLAKNLLENFKALNNYNKNKVESRKLNLTEQGKPTQIQEFRNIKSGGTYETSDNRYKQIYDPNSGQIQILDQRTGKIINAGKSGNQTNNGNKGKNNNTQNKKDRKYII